ncbi:hypothetical protein RFI_28923, partial [Reticulomyxa filosa]
WWKNQRVKINAYDLPSMVPKVSEVTMELYDCCISKFGRTFSFYNCNFEFVYKKNERDRQWSGFGNEYARKSVKLCVVSNPNTNCLILANNATNIPLISLIWHFPFFSQLCNASIVVETCHCGRVFLLNFACLFSFLIKKNDILMY